MFGILWRTSIKTNKTKTSRTMLNSSSESGHPCLVPDFRGNAFNFSPLRIMFAVGLSYISAPEFRKTFMVAHVILQLGSAG